MGVGAQILATFFRKASISCRFSTPSERKCRPLLFKKALMRSCTTASVGVPLQVLGGSLNRTCAGSFLHTCTTKAFSFSVASFHTRGGSFGGTAGLLLFLLFFASLWSSDSDDASRLFPFGATTGLPFFLLRFASLSSSDCGDESRLFPRLPDSLVVACTGKALGACRGSPKGTPKVKRRGHGMARISPESWSACCSLPPRPPLAF